MNDVLETPPTATGADALLQDALGSETILDTAPEVVKAPEGDKPAPVAEKPAAEKPKAQPGPTGKQSTFEKSAEEKPVVAKAKEEKPPKEDMNSLRQNHSKLKGELDTLQKSSSQKIAELEAKVRDAESLGTKKGDEKAAALEKRIAELQKTLSESAYERSDDYKTRFVDPYNAQVGEAAEMVERMQVRTGQNEDGTVTTRAATKQDFARIFRADPSEQAELAEKMFGSANAVRIISRIDQINNLAHQARQAVAGHQSSMEAKSKEMETQTRASQDAYDKALERENKALVEKYPQYWGDDAADPEAGAALKRGLSKIDEWTSDAEALSPEDRAARWAVIRHWAGAFPRLTRAVSTQSAKIESLEKELAAFRAKDPGAKDSEVKGEQPKEGDFVEGRGVEGLAAEFDK